MATLMRLKPAFTIPVIIVFSSQVLHVAFSHTGDLFVTCSKFGKFLVWHIIGANYEVKLKATIDMKKEKNWLNTWGGRFNKTDTLLLVAGVIDEVRP